MVGVEQGLRLNIFVRWPAFSCLTSTFPMGREVGEASKFKQDFHVFWTKFFSADYGFVMLLFLLQAKGGEKLPSCFFVLRGDSAGRRDPRWLYVFRQNLADTVSKLSRFLPRFFFSLLIIGTHARTFPVNDTTILCIVVNILSEVVMLT